MINPSLIYMAPKLTLSTILFAALGSSLTAHLMPNLGVAHAAPTAMNMLIPKVQVVLAVEVAAVITNI